jgi:hypothetical protein
MYLRLQALDTIRLHWKAKKNTIEDYEVTWIYSHRPHDESKLSADFSETVFEPHYRELVPPNLPVFLVRRYMEQVLPSSKERVTFAFEPLVVTVFHFRQIYAFNPPHFSPPVYQSAISLPNFAPSAPSAILTTRHPSAFLPYLSVLLKTIPRWQLKPQPKMPRKHPLNQ